MKPSTRQQDAVSRIASGCLAGRARLINREITNIYETALRPLGLRVSQLSILVMIGTHEPITPGEIGRILRIEKSTMSRNVERMRAKGWIKTESADDGRAQLLRLTARGRKLVERALPYWEEAQQQAHKRLGAAKVDAIHSIASAFMAGTGDVDLDQ
jgi:DNA-binding MarR family transcriptional regulator